MKLADIDINSARIMARKTANKIGTKAMFGAGVNSSDEYLTLMQYKFKLFITQFEFDYAWDKTKNEMNPRRLDAINDCLMRAGIDNTWWLPGMADANCERACANLQALLVTA